MGAIESAIKKWKREGINLFHPNDESTVIAKLNKTGRKYSRDVINLYCSTGGMVDDDSRFWSLWSLDKIVSEHSGYDRPIILFADFLINSHCYCFRFENEETSSVFIDYFDGKEPIHLTDSVNEFFELYLNNPSALEMFE